MNRKGFPESYDTRRLLRVPPRAEERATPRCGRPSTATSCTTSSPARSSSCASPTSSSSKGLNVLQVGAQAQRVRERLLRLLDLHRRRGGRHRASGTCERFLKLRETVFQDPESASSTTSPTSSDERGRRRRPTASGARSTARTCSENILPTRARAVAHPAQGRGPPRHRGAAPQALKRSGPSAPAAGRRRRFSRWPRAMPAARGWSASVGTLPSCSASSWTHVCSCGMCTARPPIASTGSTSERTELPTITNVDGSMSCWREDPLVGRGVLLGHDLDAPHQLGQAAAGELLLLVPAGRPW